MKTRSKGLPDNEEETMVLIFTLLKLIRGVVHIFNEVPYFSDEQ